jgi:hypothetical protein
LLLAARLLASCKISWNFAGRSPHPSQVGAATPIDFYHTCASQYEFLHTVKEKGPEALHMLHIGKLSPIDMQAGGPPRDPSTYQNGRPRLPFFLIRGTRSNSEY